MGALTIAFAYRPLLRLGFTSMPRHIASILCGCVCLFWIGDHVAAQTGLANRSGVANVDLGPHADLIPQYLLGLVHAPETHAELSLTEDQVSDLETLFAEIDLKWFPARNLGTAENRRIVLELESRVREWFAQNTSSEQQARLNQLELFAQGNRMLLRPDVGKRIGLTAGQQAGVAKLAAATDEAQRKLSRTQFGDANIPTYQANVQAAAKAEQTALAKIMQPDMRTKLGKLLSEPFDTTKLSRIYAMAPEFASSSKWINSSPLTMESLRGKVVVVHFYAFQCYNCHANFGIYRRWHETLTEKGVVVVGIQTPETSRERNFDAVRAAADERGLEFPIAVDLDSSSWNAWGNTMWPCVYVVDQQGYIRHWWAGELNWKGATADQTIEKVIDDLLTSAGQ